MGKRDNKKKKVVRIAKVKDSNNDDDDCYVTDPIAEDFTRKFASQDSVDVALIAEKGSVALRDYPHPRHLCGNFPFNTTSHESYCSKCFCCVCEIAAPCLQWRPCVQWRGINGHCNVSEKKIKYGSS